MRLRTFNKGLGVLTLLSGVAPSVFGQWAEQTVYLQTGWNSVFLRVDPAVPRADDLFAGLPIQAVWTVADVQTGLRPPECVDLANPEDLNCKPIDLGRWWVWLPPGLPQRPAMNLRSIRGGQVYLINASAPTTWKVVGIPSAAQTRWRKGFNLVGFHVVSDAQVAPTFATYLSGASAAFTGTRVFSILPNGALASVTNPHLTRIAPGTGFWVQSSSEVVYDGPVAIDHVSLRGINFAESFVGHTITVENLATASRTVWLRYFPSVAVPTIPVGLPSSAGDVPLAWLDYGAGSRVDQVYQWHPLQAAPCSSVLGARDQNNARRSMRLAIRRSGLAPADIGADGHGSQYEGILEVTDGAGFRRFLWTAAQVVGSAASTGAVAEAASRTGLWAGNAVVSGVSWITAPDPDPNGPDDPDYATRERPTHQEFTLPILLHASSEGAVRLLTEVTLMWREGNATTDGDYVLVTPACPPEIRRQLQAGSVRDGVSFSRRLSTAAFAFDGDLGLEGAIGETLRTGTPIVIPPRHFLNPFRHRFHPDHDCESEGECYEIQRDLTLTFQSIPPPGVVTEDWGDKVLGGTYREVVRGLNHREIHVNGRFELHKIIGVSALNGQ